MNSNASGIDGCYSCGCNDSNLFGTIVPDIFKKCCFSCSCFTCKKNIAGALVYQFNSQLKHFICGIIIHKAVTKLNKKGTLQQQIATAIFQITNPIGLSSLPTSITHLPALR